MLKPKARIERMVNLILNHLNQLAGMNDKDVLSEQEILKIAMVIEARLEHTIKHLVRKQGEIGFTLAGESK